MRLHGTVINKARGNFTILKSVHGTGNVYPVPN
jgi:hypothetical protein